MYSHCDEILFLQLMDMLTTLTNNHSANILQSIPEDFLRSNPFIRESLAQFAEKTSDHEKLEIIEHLQKFIRIVRYDDDHIYGEDDTALRPERMWLSETVRQIETARKDLFWNLYGDLAE